MMRFTSAVLLCLIIGGCGHTGIKNATAVHHVVLLWQKNPDDEAARQQIIQASKALEQIPGLERLSVGKTLPSGRKIVDSSFQVGVYMRFADQEKMRSYVNHPIHQRIVKQQIMPLIDKIVIYDFVAE